MITSTNPTTGESHPTDLTVTSSDQLDAQVRAAVAAASALDQCGREGRARLLELVAEQLEARRARLVDIAGQETGLPDGRLNGELSRSIYQFRLFADALREGSYLEAAIDHAGDTPLGPGPDLRRMLIPIGPVAVFGASNFPFAFSVAGGDTASALAAGCPVVIKAHDSHPVTSQASFEAILAALEETGLPSGSASLVYGLEAAQRLVSHADVRAVSFTGSLATGQTLMRAISQRPDPVPFYGELSSINPLIVTPGAAASRADELARGLFGSVTGSGGQLCTKPGIAFVPVGTAGDRVVDELTALVDGDNGHVLLNERIATSYDQITQRLIANGAQVAAQGANGGDGFSAAPVLLTVPADVLGPELAEECFGPLVVIVRYRELDEVVAAIDRMPHSLTATLHAEDDESGDTRRLSAKLEQSVGRLVFNGYPTGVRVSWAQHHGGPWPATNSQHTSVGVTAIRRFLRPFVWQDAPVSVLPGELHDDYDGIPRRMDGRLVLPGAAR